MGNTQTERKKGKQGFASMDKEKARLIHQMGGKASRGGGRKRSSDTSTANEKSDIPQVEIGNARTVALRASEKAKQLQNDINSILKS